MLLTFEHVTKFYGAVIGVNAVNFGLQPGITGLLGANGAGKSTIIKLASGQLRPSQGRVRVAGHAAWSTAAKHHLGYAPDIDTFYEEMSAHSFVYTMARLHGYRRGDARQRTEVALEQVGMAERANRRLAACSHGMRQRIKLAQALVHSPDLLLLDEPLAGIDPGGRREINELLFRLAEDGKTILVSSHILIEIEQLANSILMIARGRIVASGALSEIRRLLQNQPVTVEIVAQPARKLAALLVASSDVQTIEIRDDRLLARTHNSAQFFTRVAELAASQPPGLEIQRMQMLDGGAEAVFDYLNSDRLM